MKSFLRPLLALGLALLAGLAQAQTPPSMVRVHTTQGVIDMTLNPGAPITVANFLAYVRDNSYIDAMFHRSAWSNSQPFVIQAGGYRWPGGGAPISDVPTKGMIQNEFSAQRSNVQGTVAMAKLGGNPNSATSQWFINMNNNTFLDSQNGGFTVFARVTGPGMITAGKISSLLRVNLGATTPFTEMPVQNWTQGTPVERENAVLISEARELATTTQTDRLFNYLEAAFPQYLKPAKGIRGEWEGYQYSYYVTTNTFAGVKDGM
jgi:peptidyl-prolyl cis-trans isomerase A (cyclophilin A)